MFGSVLIEQSVRVNESLVSSVLPMITFGLKPARSFCICFSPVSSMNASRACFCHFSKSIVPLKACFWLPF